MQGRFGMVEEDGIITIQSKCDDFAVFIAQ